MNQFARIATTAALTVGLAVSLTACFGNSEDNGGTVVPYNPSATETAKPTAPAPKPTVQITSPVVVSITDMAENLSLTLENGESIDLLTEGNPVGWKATSSNEAVATTTDGYQEEDALFNPGVQLVGPGTATITLTSPDEAQSYTLEVFVN